MKKLLIIHNKYRITGGEDIVVDQETKVLEKHFIVSSLIFFLGIISYIIIPIEAVPNISVPYALVHTTYTGAAPEEIEAEIIKPIEDKIRELDNLDIVNAWGLQGRAYLWVQFLADSDTDESIRKLKDSMNEGESLLPNDATEVIVKELDFADIPMLIVNIYGDFDSFELTRFADMIKDEVNLIKGVNDVSIFGDVERVIKIVIDPEKLRVNNIPVEMIYQSIQMNNINMPGGSLSIDGQELTVRTIGKFDKIEDRSLVKKTLQDAIHKLNE